eukprot:1182987-Prorocentrum_minimum.AAC.7
MVAGVARCMYEYVTRGNDHSQTNPHNILPLTHRPIAVHALLVVVPDVEFVYFNALARATMRLAKLARFKVRVVRESALLSRSKESLARVSPIATAKESQSRNGRGI